MSSSGSRRLLRDERGATSIEFVFLIGALVMLVIGTVQVGRALMARNAMSHALSETVRVVHINPSTTAEEITARLAERLEGVAGSSLEVDVREIEGTTYMQIDVRFPFRIWVPLVPIREVEMRVETLAPMVSPFQGEG